MGYLLAEIVLYLVGAGLIGFVFGWAVRDGVLDQYAVKVIDVVKSPFTKEKFNAKEEDTSVSVEKEDKPSFLTKIKESWNAYYLTLTTTKTEVKEDAKVKQESVDKVVPKTVDEVVKQEIKVEVAQNDEVETVEVKKEEPKKEKLKAEKVVAKEPEVDVVVEPTVEIAKESEVELSTPSETVETIDEPNKPTLLTEAPAVGQDKLSAIKGIGPVLEKKLNDLGVYSFEQIASWDSEQEVWIGTQMAFPKRVTKEEWVKQAKELLKNK